MASNWTIMHIAEHVQLASRKGKDIADAINAPDTSMQAAGLLLAEIGHCALAHDRVLRQLRNELSPLDPMLEIAEKLALHWAGLSSALVGKIAELQAEAAHAG